MAEIRDAEIVVVGGGAVGAAAADALARAGRRDILLIEKEPSLAAATTAQAAGLVGQIRSSIDRVRLAMWSVETFCELERQVEARPSWRQVGSLRIAATRARAEEFRRLLEVAEEAGLDCALVDAAEAGRRWPGMRFEEAQTILWCPSDGYLQPSDLTMAYQHRARGNGVRFATGVRLERIQIAAGRVAGVVTNRGAIRCEMVINAAGAHAYHVARMAGLELPIVPVRHEYIITVPIAGIRPDLPAFRVPDQTLYGRPDVNSLLLGGWEPEALSLDPRSYTASEEPPAIEEDWPVLSNFAELMRPFYPAAAETGVRRVMSGWPTFTPDGRFIIGESRQVRGFVMAGGCNAHGVSGSAGIGRHLVEALSEKRPSAYVRSLSPDRFSERGWDWTEARLQAQRLYETYYAIGH
ncbi:MAG TPA: FAD-binding oxidoreductase [Alphaproteobacteria bacterium]|nr:FAD-binding oxidoreductase [Alphaproteobacteria bacterium]